MTIAMDPADLYRVLQVDPAAEHEVVRAAYRALAAKYHPDVGGPADRMAALNGAWRVLCEPVTRAAYDRQRRLRDGGGRWDAYADAAATTSARSTGTLLEFGRYAGWSIPEVARHDPDFLEWLARTPNGRRHREEIDEALGRSTATATASAPPRQRSRLRRR